MDNPKAALADHPRFGRGVFAIEDIAEGETIASFDGEAFFCEVGSDLPDHANDYAMQISRTEYRESNGICRFINHSCEPNCGIKNLIDIVAMRPIAAGEEFSWDYDMSDDSDWVMHCRCGSPRCRHVLAGFRYLPAAFRQDYEGYISDYLADAPDPIPLPASILRTHPDFDPSWLDEANP